MNIINYILIIVILGLLFSEETNRYNEIKDFEVFEKGPWKNLVPGISDQRSVKEILGIGIPSEHVKKLLCFDGNDQYKLYIYFNDSIETGKAIIDTMDFIPKNHTSMKGINWPVNFRTQEVMAPCAKWIEYSDGTGLVYEVYTSKTRYGKNQPGDLNRISFRSIGKNMAQQGDAPETGSSE